MECGEDVLTSSCHYECTLNSFSTCMTFHCQNTHSVHIIKLLSYLIQLSVNIIHFLHFVLFNLVVNK